MRFTLYYSWKKRRQNSAFSYHIGENILYRGTKKIFPLKRKLLAFVLGLFLTFAVKGQVALISAIPSSGCSPLPVLFNDSSTGGPSSWAWNFGDGFTSNKQSPGLHIYSLPGNYTVTLTVNGGSTTTKTVTVFNAPSVLFTVDTTTGCFPLNVNFTDQSLPGSGTLAAWNWDFGDGNTSNLKNPSHKYTAAGNFPVALQVVNSNGCSKVITKTGYIQIPNGVTPGFSLITSSGCKIPITVNFNNTSTGPGTLSYVWDFGDATPTSTLVAPGHTYNTSGNFPISLVVKSTSGCQDTLTKVTPILAGNVTSSFIMPDTVCVGTTLTLQNTSAPAPTISSWDFGDGTSSSAISPVKTFSVANVYNVKLTNTFGACIDSVIKKITVLTPAVADFSASATVSCDSLFTVTFTDMSVNASSWTWNFGDGKTSNQRNPTHTYTGYGNYSVTLLVSNSVGCSGTKTKLNYIQNRKPFIQLSSLNAKGCAPLSYSPVLIDTVVDGIATYAWDFGNGTTSTLASPPAVSYGAGTYYVKLTITSKGGCSASTQDTVQVGTIKPVVNFTLNPNPVCVNSAVTFTDQSTNSPNAWYWNFGNGFSSNLPNPVYNFPVPGTFTVTLIAYNNGCNDSAKKTIVINPPLAKFAYSFSCLNNTTLFSFHDSSIKADTWAWDFGDGSPVDHTQNPSHTYPSADGNYTAKLTVTNNTSGCTNATTQQVFIVKDTAHYVTNFTHICINNAATISVFQVNFSHIALYTFDFGDGTVVTAQSPATSHIYKKTGVFQVKIILTEVTGCKDTLPTDPNVVVHVSGPTAGFNAGVSTGCTGLAAVFNDLSTTDGINPIVKWIWDYGDSTPVQTYTTGPFTHFYSKQGIYTVKLKVVDASGCYDSVSRVNLITIAYPSAAFTTIDSLSCPGSPIQFVNNSKGYGLTYSWSFGDGSGAIAQVNPTHLYAKGTYDVTLKVVDQFTCTASVTKTAYITVDTPTAAFTLSNTFGTCPPLIDTFTFHGSYYKTIKWSFGDGGTSSLVDPVHYYTIPGTYTAGLTVISHGGCIATAPSATVTILGPYGALSYSPLQGCHTLAVNFNVVTSNVVKYIWVYTSTNVDSTLVPNSSFTYDSAGKFLPIVILEDATGCNVPVYGKDSIFIVGSKPNFGYDKTVLCQSGTVNFSDSTTTSGVLTNYFWDFGDGGTSTQRNPAHSYTKPGLYDVKLVVTAQTGCQDSVTKTGLIRVVANPSVDISGATSQCVTATASFQGVILVPNPSTLSWAWDFFNGQTSAVQNPPGQLYNTAGSDSVQVIATDTYGCADTVIKYFEVHPLPVINSGPDTTLCLGQNLTLNPTGGATYVWNADNTLSCTNCSNPVATPVNTTTYYVTGTSSFGCSSLDSIQVSVIKPGALQLIPLTDSICVGQGVQLIASGEALYSWTPPAGLDNPSIGNPMATPDTTTTYQVTGTDAKSCFVDTKTVTISVFKYPTVNVGPPSVTIPIGTSYTIMGTGSADIDSIAWTPVVGLSCTNCLSPVASPVTTTVYAIRVVNNGGCAALDSIRIIVTCDNNNLFVPNTFSPNGDGVNDVFYVRGKGLSTVQSMRIFNRWGQMVFEKKEFAPNDPSVGWDGTFGGKKMPSDVYIYTIEVICENSQVIPYHGNVALIR